MTSSFIEGLVAGFGIAIPFGPISILIIETSIRKGFQYGFAAGMGAASADFIFASISALAGTLVAAAIAPYSDTVRFLSAIFLIALGFWGLRKIARPLSSLTADTASTSSLLRTYFTILALTILNPITIAYFSALILRRNPSESLTVEELLIFVIGAGLASFTWQSILAGIGYALDKALTANFQKSVTLIGNLVILGFGVSTLLGLL
jgi:arginine exporter protein ArgO